MPSTGLAQRAVVLFAVAYWAVVVCVGQQAPANVVVVAQSGEAAVTLEDSVVGGGRFAIRRVRDSTAPAGSSGSAGGDGGDGDGAAAHMELAADDTARLSVPRALADPVTVHGVLHASHDVTAGSSNRTLEAPSSLVDTAHRLTALEARVEAMSRLLDDALHASSKQLVSFLVQGEEVARGSHTKSYESLSGTCPDGFYAVSGHCWHAHGNGYYVVSRSESVGGNRWKCTYVCVENSGCSQTFRTDAVCVGLVTPSPSPVPSPSSGV